MDSNMDSSTGSEVVNDTLSAALHVLAGDVCLHIGPGDVARCQLFIATPAVSICPEALSTWLCDGGHFFTLFRPLGTGGSLLFSHTNEVLYHASMDVQLAPDCPAGLAFLCQFTVDSAPEGPVPRLLVFDILSPHPPAARGDMLRGMQAHLPGPLCCVQWIGFRRYLSREFIAGLPHRIKGVVALGGDPLAGTWEASD